MIKLLYFVPVAALINLLVDYGLMYILYGLGKGGRRKDVGQRVKENKEE